ncbi:hypothetical protein MBANPS3_012449 [Mucor bainieri]
MEGHDPATTVLLFDGRIRRLELYRGQDAPVPVHGEFTCPLADILAHRVVQRRESFPMFFTAGLEFQERHVPVDPYYLGLWVGDGNRRSTTIYNQNDEPIVNYLRNYADHLGMRLTRDPRKVPNFNVPYIRDNTNRLENKLLRELQNLGVTRANLSTGFHTDIKHIPDLYKHNSREVRLGLLAGLIDSDGSYNDVLHCFRFSQSVRRHNRLFNDVVWLARSLGLYYDAPDRRWFLSRNGQNLERWGAVFYGDLNQVPCLLPRKQARERGAVRIARAIGIRSFARLAPRAFIDIQTNEDNLFLRGDFLVLRGSDNIPVDEVEEILTKTVDNFEPEEIQQLQKLSQVLSQEDVATFGAVDSQAIVSSEGSQMGELKIYLLDQAFLQNYRRCRHLVSEMFC